MFAKLTNFFFTQQKKESAISIYLFFDIKTLLWICKTKRALDPAGNLSRVPYGNIVCGYCQGVTLISPRSSISSSLSHQGAVTSKEYEVFCTSDCGRHITEAVKNSSLESPGSDHCLVYLHDYSWNQGYQPQISKCIQQLLKEFDVALLNIK